jgi:hypothetical protein
MAFLEQIGLGRKALGVNNGLFLEYTMRRMLK